ncbi:hypothetical protein QC761_0063210 [Podospora bellae-mahoneyi]|uniref:PEP-utilising enzyme C-terminal domain-containing protein n=1 Tax=Podospora bellae-mahoneyi TaxID=2093777 RepID=A0ABR0FI44_9PEZI|nr:hypothetical protein QC761_0063210 [Podospora bellae-mahoneyi]
MALVHFDRLKDEKVQDQIVKLTVGYPHKPDYFVNKLAHGLAALCATFFPRPTIIRLSDFKTNEYAGLIGGAEFEPLEESPMLGFRGASRYYSPRYRDGFALECRAIKQLREVMGFTNAVVMVPFCRTVDEAKKVLDVMAENGLRRGEGGLKVYVMCEIPSNVILAERFTEHFDGFSIGSNDLTQLTLGVDRDSGLLADLFDEQDEAVKWMIARVIRVARERGSKVGICGQAPSDHPEFARFLVEAGIDSISAETAIESRLEMANGPYLPLVEEDRSADTRHNRPSPKRRGPLGREDGLGSLFTLFCKLLVSKRVGREHLVEGDAVDGRRRPSNHLTVAMNAQNKQLDRAGGHPGLFRQQTPDPDRLEERPGAKDLELGQPGKLLRNRGEEIDRVGDEKDDGV